MLPITLAFSSSAPDKYTLDAANYDRRGRLLSEEYVLDRDDAPDPLADYFGSGMMLSFGGGLRGMPVLTPKPVGVALFLNDWFRCDHAGHYRLFVKSHRLSRAAGPGETGIVHIAPVSPPSRRLPRG